MHPIILFDGECNLCKYSVQFIIKRDPKPYFKFASLQSNIGSKLKESHHLSSEIDSLVLIDNNSAYTKSSAALRICKYLKGPWKAFVIFLIIPKPLRDIVYELISTSRYKWFGKNDHCIIPTDETRDRFL